MKFKKLMLVTFVLLAILTMGAVSASDNADFNETLTADTVDKLSADTPLSEEVISAEANISSEMDAVSEVVDEAVGVSESGDDLGCNTDDFIALTDEDLTFENDNEYPFNVWIWDDNNPLGPVYLDTLHDVVSINVWSQGVNGTFYVLANGKEYKYKVNYDLDENGGWRNWMLSSFDITEPGIYPVTVTYGTDNDHGIEVAQQNLTVKAFNYDTFRVINYQNTHLIALYCPNNAEGNVSVFIRIQGDGDYPAQLVKTHAISSADYNKWLNWTYDELGCQMENGYDVTVKIIKDIDEIFSYDDGLWYSEYWQRDYVPNQTTIEINHGDIWDDEEWVINLLIPESSSVSGGTLKISSRLGNIFSKTLNYWDMDMDGDCRLYQYQVAFKNIKNKKNLKNLKNNDIVTFEFTYDDNGTQKTVKRVAFYQKDDATRFDTLAYIRGDGDSRGPVYLDTADSVVSIDVWRKGITGTFYVFANGKEYRYRVNYNMDENGGNRFFTLDSLGITEPGVYPVTVTYGSEDDHGDVIEEGFLNVYTFNNDTFRAITCDDSITLYCPDNAEGNISVFIKKDDVEEYSKKPVKTHTIVPGDYNAWINWTFKNLGCKLENGYSILIKITADNNEIFYYEDNFWYDDYEQDDFAPNQTCINIESNVFWEGDDSEDNRIATVCIPEAASVYGGTLTIKSGTKTVFSKYINYWEMDFNNDKRFYEYIILFNDLNLKGLNSAVLKYNFTYNGGSISKISFFEKLEDDDRGTGYSFDFIKVNDANILDDEVVLLISDFPYGADDEFNITVDIWGGRQTVTSFRISNLTRNEDGLYALRASDLTFDMYDLYPDARYNLIVDFYKDGNEYLNYWYDGWIYCNPSIADGEISLDDDENYVLTFIKKPNIDEKFTIFVKKDGKDFSNKTMTLSQLDKYYNDDEGGYMIRPDVFGINETGHYELTVQCTHNGTPLSYSNTFDIVEFVIVVRYSDDDPWSKIADDIGSPIFIINLPENSNGRVIVSVNGTAKVNKTLSEIGYTYWNRMGSYYINVNDLQIFESGKYNVVLEVYDGEGSLRRSVETNLTVAVSPNTFEFTDGAYFFSNVVDLIKVSLGTPLQDGTVITLYLNDKLVFKDVARTGFYLDDESPLLDKFYDQIRASKAGNYVAKVTFTYSNGTEVTQAEGPFSILTKSGNVNVTLTKPALTVDHAYVNIAAAEPENSRDFVLRIYVDPDSEDIGNSFIDWDSSKLMEVVWSGSTKKIDLGTLSAGSHRILVTYYLDDEDNMFSTDFFSKLYTFTVQKTPAVITASKVTATYKVTKKLVINLKDSKGKAIAKRKVTVKVGTISKTLTTNSQGKVSVVVSSLVPKKYTATVKFAGDKNFKAATKKVQVVVKKAAPKMVVSKKVYKVKVKIKKVNAILKDNKGKAIKSAKLVLSIGGKKYVAKTNAKGVATFKVSNLAKKVTFKGVVKFAGNKYFKALNRVAVVVVK